MPLSTVKADPWKDVKALEEMLLKEADLSKREELELKIEQARKKLREQQSQE
jgi:hypothetical protein